MDPNILPLGLSIQKWLVAIKVNCDHRQILPEILEIQIL